MHDGKTRMLVRYGLLMGVVCALAAVATQCGDPNSSNART